MKKSCRLFQCVDVPKAITEGKKSTLRSFPFGIKGVECYVLVYHETTHCENVGIGTNITYQKNCTDGKEDLPMSIGRRKLSVFLFTGFLIRIERNSKSDFPHYEAPVLLRRFPIGHSLHQTHGFGLKEFFRID